jgi:hypothetical protein
VRCGSRWCCSRSGWSQSARNRVILLRALSDLSEATGALTALTREAGTSSSALASLGTIADQLPVYSGLVESARANNRQGFPIGAAYLRQAATLSTTTILPAADRLYAVESGRLNDDYRTPVLVWPANYLAAAAARPPPLGSP